MQRSTAPEVRPQRLWDCDTPFDDLSDRRDSLCGSPCLSDETSRMMRDLIPGTPSPTYGYEGGFRSDFASGRGFPRFFPFAVNDASALIMTDRLMGDRQLSHASMFLAESYEDGSKSPSASKLDDGDSHFESQELPVSNSDILNPVDTSLRSSTSMSTSLTQNNLSALDSSSSSSNTILTPTIESSGCTHILNNGNFHQLQQQPSPLLSVLRGKMACLSTSSSSAIALADLLPFSEALCEAVEFSQDQFGSRYLQSVIESSKDPSQVQDLFLAVVPEIHGLCVDPFGNYVIQKLLEYPPAPPPSPSIRLLLTEQLIGHVLSLSLNTYGCRVVQKVFDSLTSPSHIPLLSSLALELKGHVITCVEDQNGNHVIQRCIEKLPLENISFLLDEFKGFIHRMSLHCYGCRVVQRLIERLPVDSLEYESVTAEISSSLWTLAQDQYGNYVIQHLLLHGRDDQKGEVVRSVSLRVVDYSCHKFASNIAEKAIIVGGCDGEVLEAIIGSGGNDSPLYTLTRDRFANYVVQRCLEFSSGVRKVQVLTMLRSQLPQLKKVAYGKHIANAVERLLSTNSTTVNPHPHIFLGQQHLP